MLESMKGWFEQFKAQFSSFYGSLSSGRKSALVMGLVALTAILVGTISYRPTPKFEVAYTGVAAEDQQKIVKLLKSKNVTDFKIDGEDISFPEEKAADYRMLLAEEGLPGSGVGVGWEKFDERSFGMTDFDQRVNKLRAIQGEIARTINKLEPVQNSRVHVVIPDQAIFAEDKKLTTASVSLKLKPGKTLSAKQIQGILHITAHAVEGLNVANIAIVDQEGNILTRTDDDEGGLERTTATQREYQKRVEREMESKIREILSRIVGSNKTVAKVQAEVEFKKVETTIQDVDPDRTVVTSSQRSEQSSAGSGTNPTGVPGAKSNLPGERDDLASAGGSSQKNTQNNEIINYDVRKTTSRIVEPVGTIKKLSAAVLVDGKMVDGKFVLRTAPETEMLLKLVKNAIGFQEGRDSLTVEQAQFEADEFAIAELASQKQKKDTLTQTSILSAVAILGMVFLYFAVLRPYFRWLTFNPEKEKEEQFAVMDYELERHNSKAKRVQVQEETPFEQLSQKEQILHLAKSDPKKTTEALRQFLSPHQS